MSSAGGAQDPSEERPDPAGDSRRPTVAQGAGGASSFAAIPAEIRHRVARGERVLLILLDAFGRSFLERHAAHPLIQRLAVTPLDSQFPSTTTAHVTTLNWGVPVEQHGLYEWFSYDPASRRVITALVDPPDLGGLGETFYERFGVPSLILQPSGIHGSPYSLQANAGAAQEAFSQLSTGVRRALEALQQGKAAYVGLYWDEIDSVGHVHGPGAPEFDAAALAALDAIWSVLSWGAGDVTVLFTADHGQVDVSPERVDYLDRLWPELPRLLSVAAPAGSPRDVFLHTGPELAPVVIDGLSSRLGERARVLPALELFPEAGPRLRERIGDVLVLPAPGRMAWLSSHPGNEMRFRGMHGGLELDETATYLAQFQG